jgi:hypothetical protein
MRAAVALVALASIVLIGTAPASAAGMPGGLDGIAAIFAGTPPHVAAVAADWSSKIFYAIVILDLLWTLYECIRTNTLEQLIDTLIFRVVGYALGVYLVTHQIAITTTLLDTIGQISTAFALPGAAAPLTPNAIALLGWTVAGALGNAMPQGNPAISLQISLPLFFCSLLLQIAFLVVAVEYLVIQIGVQLCIAVGSVLLGLVGTRWTRPLAALWPRMIVAALLLSVVIGAVAGLGTMLSAQILAAINAIGGQPIGSVLQDLATISAASLVYLMLSLFLTGLAAFIGGQTPLTVGGAVINAVSNGFAYMTGYNAGSQTYGGSSPVSRPNVDRDPVATIEAATTTAT